MANVINQRQAQPNRLAAALVSGLFAELAIPAAPVGVRNANRIQELGYTPDRTSVLFYAPNVDWNTNSRCRVGLLAAFLRWPVTNAHFDPSDVPTWVYTCIDFAFPGLSRSILERDTNVVIDRIVVTNDMFARVESPDCPAYVAPPVVPDPPAPFETGLIVDTTAESAEWLHLIGALTTLLFSLGKNVTDVNFSAFTERRPQAIAAKMGGVIDQSSPLSASRLPRLEHYRLFTGHFNMNPAQRRHLVRTLLNWDHDSNPAPERNVVVTQTRLWKHSGLTHLFLVRDFLQNYGDAVIMIPGLRTEIQAFMNTHRDWVRSTDPDRDYLRVLDGDRAQLGHSREYVELLNLARGVASAVDTKFAQYATGLGESPYKRTFVEACEESGLALPESYADVESTGEGTGGGVREN